MENPEIQRFERFLASKKIAAQKLYQAQPDIYHAWFTEFTGRSEAHFWQRFHFKVNAVRRTLDHDLEIGT